MSGGVATSLQVCFDLGIVLLPQLWRLSTYCLNQPLRSGWVQLELLYDSVHLLLSSDLTNKGAVPHLLHQGIENSLRTSSVGHFTPDPVHVIFERIRPLLENPMELLREVIVNVEMVAKVHHIRMHTEC